MEGQGKAKGLRRKCTLMENVAHELAYLTSHAVMMSIPSPNTGPCTAAMTGNGQRSGAWTERWKARMKVRELSARRAGSVPRLSVSARLATMRFVLVYDKREVGGGVRTVDACCEDLG